MGFVQVVNCDYICKNQRQEEPRPFQVVVLK